MDTSLAASFLESVRQAGDSIKPPDQALVDLGLRYALQIDAGMERGGQDATKALYLGPHLVNVCRELGLSPSARAGGPVADGGRGAQPAVADELSAMRRRHRGGA